MPPCFAANRSADDEGDGDASGQNADRVVQPLIGLDELPVVLLFLDDALLGFLPTLFFSGDMTKQCVCPRRGDDEREHDEGDG